MIVLEKKQKIMIYSILYISFLAYVIFSISLQKPSIVVTILLILALVGALILVIYSIKKESDSEIESVSLEEESDLSRKKAQFIQMQKNGQTPKELRKLKKSMAKDLLALDQIYVPSVIINDVFFPFLSEKEEAYVFSEAEAEAVLAKYCEKEKQGKYTLVSMDAEEFKTKIRMWQDYGIYKVLLDWNSDNISIPLKYLMEFEEKNAISEENQYIRGKLLLLQQHRQFYYAEAKALGADWRKSYSKKLREESKACLEDMQNALFYVLGKMDDEVEVKQDTTLLSMATGQILLDTAYDDYMEGTKYLNPGDKELDCYEGEISFRTIKKTEKRKDQVHEKNYLCIFTDSELAKVAGDEMNHGDEVFMVTFDEILIQAMDADGIVVDLNTIGHIMKKESYQAMGENLQKES